MPQPISNLAVGDTIEVPVNTEFQSQYGETIVFKVADKNHYGYPDNSVTLITDKIISWKCFDAKEIANSNGTTTRDSYGNNRYVFSNIRQWLNSKAPEGKWYTAQHMYDAPPTAENISRNGNSYISEAGFLYILKKEFIEKVMDTTHTVAVCPYDVAAEIESCTDKFFLASATEIGEKEDKVCGTMLKMFENSSITASVTPACANYHSLSTSNKYRYWIAKASSSYDGSHVWSVTTDTSESIEGGLTSYSNAGIRPLCNVPSSLNITNTLNSNGNYELVLASKIEIKAKMSELTTQPKAARVILPRNGVLTSLQVCNNYNDTTPTWEDATEDKEHIFSNSAKTADNWAVGIHVVIDKESTESIYLGGPTALVR